MKRMNWLLVLAMVLALLGSSALAESCKYAGQGSPCEPGWWVDRENRQHARACFYHVEEKEDMNSHVLITPWEPCTLDDGGECTGCGWDYDTSDEEPGYEEYEMYMLEAYFCYREMYGTSPVEVTEQNGKLTITFKDDFFSFMDDMGFPYGESVMVKTDVSLAEVGGVWTVEVSEYGAGAWMQRMGLLKIGSVSESGAEITIDGETHTLGGSVGSVDPDRCKYYQADSPCNIIWWLDKENMQHCRACKNHVEDKEDPYSYVRLTEWTDCTPGEDYICTGCGWDYSPAQGPTEEDYDAYMEEIYSKLLEKKGVPPMDVTVSGDTLTIKINEQFRMYMLEYGIPVTETLMVGTEYTLKQVNGAWAVTSSEYGPGAWLERMGLLNISPVEAGNGTMEAALTLDGGETYTLTTAVTGGGEEAPVLPEGALGTYTPSAGDWYFCDSCHELCGDIASLKAYYDADSHWWLCPDCGAENHNFHVSSCDALGACIYCGASGVNIHEVYHQMDDANPRYGHDQYAHWDACTVCGEACGASFYYPHYALCTAPDTCAECGATDVLMTTVDHVGENKYQHDETHHWYVCTGCGKTEKSLHSGFCFQRDKCNVCLAEDVVVGEYEHDLTGYTRVSDTQCAKSCVRCGYVSAFKKVHMSYCSAPDTCIYCEASGIVSDYVGHQADEQMQHDADGHWLQCVSCVGEPLREAHQVLCSNPTVCRDCGATGVEGAIGHEGETGAWQYDQEYHWGECAACGEKFNVQRHHMEWCGTPYVCDDCGAVGVDGTIGMHSYHGLSQSNDYEYIDGYFFFDENGHWLHCSRCGDETPKLHELDSEGVCRYCGYEYISPVRIPGDASGDGVTNIMDALLILQADVGWSVELDRSASDVNADGTVNIMDALLILQYDVGWDVELK